MAISALPPAPSTNDPETFAAKGDALLAALPTFVTEANTLQSEVNANQTAVAADTITASNAASSATASKDLAAASELSATNSANAASTSATNALGYLNTMKASSYGALASDPELDPLGNPPTVGDEYFNTTVNLMKHFNGSIWVASDINTGDLAASTGSSLIGHISSGNGAVYRTTQSKLRDIVSVKDFGAIADGITDVTVSIQNALNSGASRIKFGDGTYLITAPLNITQDWQKLKLSQSTIIYLSTTDVNYNVFNVTGNGVVIEGGTQTTSLRTLKFLTNLAGEKCKLKNALLTFATKSIEPSMVYNRGGVALNGDGCELTGCEITNQEGIGAVIYGDKCVVSNNRIHNNIAGIHGSFGVTRTVTKHCLITDNFIYDNDVNNASGADGILINTYDGSCVIRNNIVTNGGEHGMYIRAYSSIIQGNVVYSNYGSGIKVRDQINSTISNNICYGNATSGDATQAEIYYQVSEYDSNNVSILNNNLKVVGSSYSIRTAYTNASIVLTNLTISGNTCVGGIEVAVSSGLVLTDNSVTGNINIAASSANDPSTQTGALVSDNKCSVLNMGRASSCSIENNIITSLNSGSNVTDSNNTIKGNKISAQGTQIHRNSFSVFNNNIVNCAGLATTLLVQGSNSTQNSFKQIIGNRFIAHTARVIDDSTSGSSGSKNIISNNIFDSSVEGISMWGIGHSIMGNINIGAGGVGYVGCNNSWLIGNSPIISLRAGTTGNVVS